MTSKRIYAAVAATVAAALSLTACGSSGSSAPGGGGGGATIASSGGATGSSGGATGGSATVASKLIFGGPAEFKTRVDGIPGLKKNYGLSFQSYKVTDTGGPITVNSLKNGQIDAADLFTTDPAIKANNFVVLTDPKNDFGAQNVLPLISKKTATAGVKQVLDFISSKLTTNDLISLRTKVEVQKQDADAVAKQYLKSLNPPTTTPAKGVSITVGSANFPENVVIADIYADALQAAGANVTKKLNIGSREKYIDGLKDGSIDLIPEYNGVLLQFLDKNATAVTSDAIFKALPAALPSNLTVLPQAQAQDADAVVVTAATAKKYNLTSIADLAKSP